MPPPPPLRPVKKTDDTKENNKTEEKKIEWYYSADGERKGPVNQSEIENLLSTSQINNSAHVWNGTTVTEWTRVDQTTEFASFVVKPKPVQPPPPPRMSILLHCTIYTIDLNIN